MNPTTTPTPSTQAPAHGHTHVPLGYGKRTWLRVLIGAIVLFLALGAVYVVGNRTRHETAKLLKRKAGDAVGEKPTVTVVRAEACAPTRTLELPGQVRALLEATLHARTSGYLTAMNVDIGDRVKKGQLLAVIETPELAAQINEAKAKIQADKAELRLVTANAGFARTSVDRYKAAAPEGGVSQQELDQKLTELSVAEAKIESQKAKIALSEAELEKLQAVVDFGRIVAPFDGVITQRWVDVGALITAGSTSNTTPLLRLEAMDKVRVVVDVPQRASVDLTVGLPVNVRVDELGAAKFTGKITRTSSQIDRAGTLRVEAEVDNGEHKLLPGMYVNAAFTQPASLKAVRVPSSALSFRTSGPQVAIVDEAGKVTFRPVTIVRDLGDFVELGSGVQEQQSVALNISSFVQEGDQVSPVSDDRGATKTATGQAK